MSPLYIALHWAVTGTSHVISCCRFHTSMRKNHHKKLGIINFYKEEMQSPLLWVMVRMLFSNDIGAREVAYWVKTLANVRTLIQVPITHIKAGSICNSIILTENWKYYVRVPFDLHFPHSLGRCLWEVKGQEDKKVGALFLGPSLSTYLSWRPLLQVSGPLLSHLCFQFSALQTYKWQQPALNYVNRTLLTLIWLPSGNVQSVSFQGPRENIFSVSTTELGDTRQALESVSFQKYHTPKILLKHLETTKIFVDCDSFWNEENTMGISYREGLILEINPCLN